jgi:hypothetical protein
VLWLAHALDYCAMETNAFFFRKERPWMAEVLAHQ